MLALFFVVFGVVDAGGATGFVGGHAVAATSVFGVTVVVVARVTVLCLIVAGVVTVDSVVLVVVVDAAAVGIFVPAIVLLRLTSVPDHDATQKVRL